MNAIVYPMLIMLALGWAALLGHIVTVRARKVVRSNPDYHQQYKFPDRPLYPPPAAFGPCQYAFEDCKCVSHGTGGADVWPPYVDSSKCPIPWHKHR